MSRRVLLLCLLVVLAGCAGTTDPAPTTPSSTQTTTTTQTASPTATPTPEVETQARPDNPFQSDPIRVGYAVDENALNRSYKQAVVGAIDFWNNQSVGSYDANYTYVSNASEAQIVIQFVDKITYCDGYDNSTVGCAPVLEKDDVALTQTVRVEDRYAMESTQDIIIHELGHTRGLVHEDSNEVPVMNETIGTLLIPETNLENRSYGWQTTSFRVYFDTSGTVSSVEEDTYRQEIREGWQYWTKDTDHLEKDVSFRFVDSREEANIVVKMRDHEGVRWEYWVFNTDSDDSFEVYQNATLYVGERNPEYIDYNTATALGYLLLNAENETELPEPFDGDDELGETDQWTD